MRAFTDRPCECPPVVEFDLSLSSRDTLAADCFNAYHSRQLVPWLGEWFLVIHGTVHPNGMLDVRLRRVAL